MSEMNLEQARHNMIVQQIRPWEVIDDRVLTTLSEVPREAFVPAAYRNMAFTDIAIPLPNNQVMLPPKVEARILQALNVQEDDTILEVGTGSGYFTALLSRLGKHVYSIDIDEEMTRLASANLQAQNIQNVTLETGDAARGWDKHQPYDVIVVTGSMPVLPDTFQHDLAVGGRLVAIVGRPPIMEVVLITRTGPAEWSRDSLFETSVPALKNAADTEQFRF